MELTPLINQVLSLGTVAGQIVFVGLLASLVLNQKKVLSFVATHAILFSFFVALASLIGSLLYSEISGYEPCNLCWLQRIFIYPQVVILGMALWKRDRNVADYSIALSGIGAAIALYQTLLQMGVTPGLPCAAYSASCAQRFVLEYGYITIPFMALTAFSLIIIFMISQKLHTKVDSK